jgi:hypothetical protein
MSTLDYCSTPGLHGHWASTSSGRRYVQRSYPEAFTHHTDETIREVWKQFDKIYIKRCIERGYDSPRGEDELKLQEEIRQYNRSRYFCDAR